jgi:tetratricopeptide (TPR) repeat protein
MTGHGVLFESGWGVPMSRPNSDAESIFLAALERADRSGQAEFVASACGRDEALRRRVEALLRAHDLAGSFLGGPPAGVDLRAFDLTDAADGRPAGADTLTILSLAHGAMPRVLLRDPLDGPETPVPGPPTADEPSPRPPSSRYHFFGEIARGGMGAILKGHDSQLNRDLAIKVLLDRHRDNAELVRRFVEEAQIGGQLQHPGIVPIYELGVLPDRRPFFAMKLVKGLTLSELLGGRPDPADDRPRLLSIFEAVCQTVAYAHARGVIHRDLKPSNVMVGSFGEVQVMDWGLAKVLPRGGVADDGHEPTREPDDPVRVVHTARSGSGADASQAGSVLGTPGYMSPEQARGELDQVDERADVFGLGAILCEVLTGEPAFVGRSPAETLRKAGRGELAEAFARLDGCRADPELIALARDCLTPGREDRPRRAGTVAGRMTAYLAGVQERLRKAELERVTADARAEEERKRRRLAMALAAAVMALVGLVGGGYAWLERQRAARTLAAAQGINDALVQAAALGARADGPPGDLSAWGGALAEIERAEDLIRQHDPGRESTEKVRLARADLERGRDAARAEAEQLRRDRELLERLEAIRIGLGEHWDAKRADADYAAAFRDAGMDLDRLDPAEAGALLRRRFRPAELASFLDDWAAVRLEAGRAEADRRRLMEAARAADPDPWRDAVRLGVERDDNGAIRKLADDEQALDALPAASVVLLGRRLTTIGDRAMSEAMLRRAQRLRPDDFWINFTLAQACESASPGPDRLAEAVRFYSIATALRPKSFASRNNLGSVLRRQGRTADAIAEYREARRLRPDERRTRLNLGSILCEDAHDPDAGIAEYREAVRLRPDLADTHASLGHALCERGELDGAIAELREAIRLDRQSANARHNMGTVLGRQGKFAEAAAEFREAIRLRPDLADAHTNLGGVLVALGEIPRAIAEAREAIRLDPRSANAHNTLGGIMAMQRKNAEAAAEFDAAVRLQPGSARNHSNLGGALIQLGEVSRGIAELRESIRLDPRLATPRSTLGVALRRQGKLADALPEFREAVRLEPENVGFLRNLSFALDDLGEYAAAAESLRKAADLSRANPQAARQIEPILAAVRRRAELAPRLPALIRGDDQPRGADEKAVFAELLHRRKRYGLAARLLAEAFEAAPGLAADISAGRRYNAACTAALAGAGKAEGEPPPGEPERPRLRRLALDWLRDDLAVWSRHAREGTRPARAAVTETLMRWKLDPDLAGVRDEAAIGALPAREQKDWRALWAEVGRLLEATPPR